MAEISTFDAKQWVLDQLDESGFSAPNTDLRSIHTSMILDGYIKVRKCEDPSYHSQWSISEEIAQAICDQDKRHFIFRAGTDFAILRYNGKRCKEHGNEGFRLDEHRMVIHGEPCQLCSN